MSSNNNFPSLEIAGNRDGEKEAVDLKVSFFSSALRQGIKKTRTPISSGNFPIISMAQQAQKRPNRLLTASIQNRPLIHNPSQSPLLALTSCFPDESKNNGNSLTPRRFSSSDSKSEESARQDCCNQNGGDLSEELSKVPYCDLLKCYKDLYMNHANDDHSRDLIMQCLIQASEAHGKFLEQNPKTGKWKLCKESSTKSNSSSHPQIYQGASNERVGPLKCNYRSSEMKSSISDVYEVEIKKTTTNETFKRKVQDVCSGTEMTAERLLVQRQNKRSRYTSTNNGTSCQTNAAPQRERLNAIQEGLQPSYTKTRQISQQPIVASSTNSVLNLFQQTAIVNMTNDPSQISDLSVLMQYATKFSAQMKELDEIEKRFEEKIGELRNEKKQTTQKFRAMISSLHRK